MTFEEPYFEIDENNKWMFKRRSVKKYYNDFHSAMQFIDKTFLSCPEGTRMNAGFESQSDNSTDRYIKIKTKFSKNKEQSLYKIAIMNSIKHLKASS